MSKLRAYAILAYGPFAGATEALHFDRLAPHVREKLNYARCEISAVSVYGLIHQLGEPTVLQLLEEFDKEWPKIDQETREALAEETLEFFRKQLGDRAFSKIERMNS